MTGDRVQGGASEQNAARRASGVQGRRGSPRSPIALALEAAGLILAAAWAVVALCWIASGGGPR